jgi:hypothetical protein
MEDSRKPNRELQCIPNGGRRRGKPRKMWLDDVKGDLRKIRVKCWRIKVLDRTECRKICETTKVLQEL